MVTFLGAVEPRYNEGPSDWQNLLVISRFVFHIFYPCWVKENRSLYRGLRYIKFRYIEVPLYLLGLELSDAGKRIGIGLRWTMTDQFALFILK